MLSITNQIKLHKITLDDSKVLYTLMKEVYPDAYQHFWKDKGDWYVNSLYSKKNIEKELLESKADYYFVVYKDEIIGNFRILWDEKLKGFEDKKIVKLHRIYLHPKTQGNGIGKIVLRWLENKAKEKRYEIIWLDAMEEQPQAFEFYKKQGYKYHSHCFLDFDLLHDHVRKMSQIYKKL